MTTPVEFRQHKDVRGRKIARWTALLGNFEGEGTDKATAQDALLTILRGAQPFARTYLFANDGKTLFAVHQDVTTATWLYDITDPGRAYPCSCLGFKTREECEKAARTHMEQSFGGVVEPRRSAA